MQVRDWRVAWNHWHRDPKSTLTGQVRRHLFNIAVEIYASSIHTRLAEFPINIEGKTRSHLDAVFGVAVLDLKREHDDTHNDITPFMNHPRSSGFELKSPIAFSYSESGLSSGHTRSHSQEMILPLPSPSRNTSDVESSAARNQTRRPCQPASTPTSSTSRSEKSSTWSLRTRGRSLSIARYAKIPIA